MSFTEKLNRAAYTAGGLVAGGYLTEHESRTLLIDAADCARPHQSRRNLYILNAGLNAGRARPIQPKEST
ncbi:hypothetical protein [Streptomyces sp. NPDC001774]